MYKDARVDMNRLDAVYNVTGWQKKYELINGNLFCSIGIWCDTKGQWIWKQDVGTESASEKEKGQASDAFKRAGFNLGIGRELYDYPLISFKLNDDEVIENNGNYKASFNLKIREWKWVTQFEDNKLSFIGCKDLTGKLRFSWGKFKES